MEQGIVAALVSGRGDPPADVDVVAVGKVGGERGSAAERVEVAAADVAVLCVVDGVGEGLLVAELALVPDEVDEVAVGGDRFGWPGSTTRLADQVDAGADAGYVVVEVVSVDRPRLEFAIDEAGRDVGASRH